MSCESVPSRSNCVWNWRWSCSVKPQPPGSSAAQIVLKYWFCCREWCRTEGARRQAYLQNTKPLGGRERKRWEEREGRKEGRREGEERKHIPPTVWCCTALERFSFMLAVIKNFTSSADASVCTWVWVGPVGGRSKLNVCSCRCVCLCANAGAECHPIPTVNGPLLLRHCSRKEGTVVWLA